MLSAHNNHLRFLSAFIAGALLLTLASCASRPEGIPDTALSLEEFEEEQSDEAFGEQPVLVWGFITLVYHCPPCPEGAQCKPCLDDHIRLADALDAQNRALVFVEDLKPFALGEPLAITVRVEKYDTFMRAWRMHQVSD